ncbi:PEGA domain-containing protein [Lysobacter sp. LF1]|uniref:PEGA domain-containing protein n=1 Tax=Lysobacter stagni TaxID=3045172 RepID=A0ABT6XD08_9GAMM|nr:PEGA domain-containing protein [Lysobacter sp. LF1]MDI9238027.1 PEGA domain-containing protein [Lysobacter sp. LF1]
MLAVVLCALANLVGCATVTRGTTQAFSVESTPLGATVSLSNGERCDTPCTLTLKRKHPVAVQVCKTGYAPVETVVQSQVSGAGAAGMAGNVLLGGLIGAGVDAASGATKELRPNPLSLQLVAAEPGCEAPTFPAVPENGQTPEEYAKTKKKKKKSADEVASN